MKTYACVNQQTKVVDNVVVWDGIQEWSAPDGYDIVELTDCAGIGWMYQNGQFIRPLE